MNTVNNSKKVDVNHLLLSLYGEEWRNNPHLKFYKFVLQGNNQEGNAGETTVCEAGEEDCSPII